MLVLTDYSASVIHAFLLLGFFVMYTLRGLRVLRPQHGIRIEGSRTVPHDYAFTEHGIQIRSEGYRADYDWSAVLHASEQRGHFILMLDRDYGIAVAKRRLAGETDISALRQLLERQVGPLGR